MPTTWRLLDRIDAEHLESRPRGALPGQGEGVGAGAGPDLAEELLLDFDATITIAHSEKGHAAATWKRTFGVHPLPSLLDRPDLAKR